jgi:PAS domain S-box-containing protein
VCADERASVEAPLADLEEVERELTRLRAELAAARQQEREHANFFDNTTLLLHWVGPNGTILRANQAELDLLGYTGAEYVGHHVAEFHLDRPVVDELLGRLNAGEIVRDFPSRLRCKDGSVRAVLIDASAYREGGRFVHTRWVLRDLSTQLRTEEDLQRSQERVQLAARATEDLIWDWDLVRGQVIWKGGIDGFFAGSADALGSSGDS